MAIFVNFDDFKFTQFVSFNLFLCRYRKIYEMFKILKYFDCVFYNPNLVKICIGRKKINIVSTFEKFEPTIPP